MWGCDPSIVAFKLNNDRFLDYIRPLESKCFLAFIANYPSTWRRDGDFRGCVGLARGIDVRARSSE